MKAWSIIAFLFGSIAWGADPPSAERVRAAAEKGLTLLQKTQQMWASKVAVAAPGKKTINRQRPFCVGGPIPMPPPHVRTNRRLASNRLDRSL